MGRIIKKIIFASVFLLFVSACPKDKFASYEDEEITLADFSKKITGYYNGTIPKDFDEKEFIAVLEKIYPDKTRVETVKNNFKVMARPAGDYYSVVLCDLSSNKKLMEDFNCNLSMVELRYWDKNAAYSCKFEEDWKRYCE